MAAQLSQEIIKIAATERLEPEPGGRMETRRASLFDKELFTDRRPDSGLWALCSRQLSLLPHWLLYPQQTSASEKTQTLIRML